MRQLFLLLIICVTLASNGQVSHSAEKILELGKVDNRTMQWLNELSNRIGGRPIGSPNYDAAVQWAAMRFREWGMEVVLDSVTTLPVGFNRGPAYGRMLAENGMVLHFVTPSYTAGTKGLQRGHVLIEPKTQQEFDRMKGELKGAWVLISGKNNGWPIDISPEADAMRMNIRLKNEEIEKQNEEIRRQNRNGEQKPLIPTIDEPALFYKEMVDAGVLGIIQSAEIPLTAMYDRKNLSAMRWDNLPQIPDIKLNAHQFAIIEQMAKERRYFQLEFDIRNHFRPGPLSIYNVFGVIPGVEFPDELVLVGGHLDSYDVSTGASDNASGVVPAMEAARLIMASGAKPRRTILVTLWAGEEFGLLGSTAWVSKNKASMNKISAMFNRDGGPNVATSISVTEAMFPYFEEICRPLTAYHPDFPFKVLKSNPSPKPKKPGGTDTAPFIVEDVPTFAFGSNDPYGTNFSYREIWHTERDTYEKCRREYMEHTSVVTAITILGVANLDFLLPRTGMWKEENSTAPVKNKKK